MEWSELFGNPRVLFALPFLLPFFLWLRRRERGFISGVSLRAFRQARGLRVFLAVSLPYGLLWFLIALSIAALADPQKKVLQPQTFTHGYRAGIIVDDSGSMSESASGTMSDWEGTQVKKEDTKTYAAQRAGIAFVERRPNDVFSFLPFGTSANFGGGIKFTTDRALVIEAISRLEGKAGSTAIGDGYLGSFVFLLNDVAPIDPATEKKRFLVDFQALKDSLAAGNGAPEAAYREEVYERLCRIEGAFIFNITDAENNSGIDPILAVNYIAECGVPVFLVSVGTVQDQRLIRALERSGGGYFFAHSEKEIAQMVEKIDKLKPVRITRGAVTAYESQRPLLAMIAAAVFLLMIVLYAFGLRIH